LLAGLADVDRLVLLGDLIELRQGPLRRVLSVALPVLAELGAAVGPEKEIVIVPGNHDHRLLKEWRRRRPPKSQPLGLETAVDFQPAEPLGAVAEALGQARVRVSYPGLWLRPDVYAMHGHYLDRHITVPLLERLGAGLMDRLTSSDDYEAVLAPMYDLIGVVADRGVSTGLGLQTRVWRGLERGRERRGGHESARLIPGLVRTLNVVGLGPLSPDLSGAELRRAGLRAFAEVLNRLGVSADYVIFGHTHRAGLLPGDETAEWVTDTGTRMVNSGCWVHSRTFTGPRPHLSPYRAGFAVEVEDEEPPRVINLLDPLRERTREQPASAALRPDPA